MKKKSFKRTAAILRISIIVFLLSIVSLFLFSFTVSRKLGDDLWKQLGISQQQGKEQIRNSFMNGYFDYYGGRNAKNLLAGNRSAVAKDLLQYARQFISSPVFKTEYEKARMQAKPVAPERAAKTKEEIRNEKIGETKELIKKTEDIIKTADVSLRKAMEEVLQMHKANLKDYQDPNSQMIDLFYQQEVFQNAGNMDNYKEELKKWEEAYPAGANTLIKMRLSKYLSLSATVDFTASLTEKNGRKRFVKPEYEAKNSEWKMIFRAGKEVYEVAKPFAEQWLRELEK